MCTERHYRCLLSGELYGPVDQPPCLFEGKRAEFLDHLQQHVAKGDIGSLEEANKKKNVEKEKEKEGDNKQTSENQKTVVVFKSALGLPTTAQLVIKVGRKMYLDWFTLDGLPCIFLQVVSPDQILFTVAGLTGATLSTRLQMSVTFQPSFFERPKPLEKQASKTWFQMQAIVPVLPYYEAMTGPMMSLDAALLHSFFRHGGELVYVLSAVS